MIAYSTYDYTYENAIWGGKLSSYRDTPFLYDSLGNPLNYHNGSDYSFTWQNGRQLKSATKGGSTFLFTYDAEGRRTSKVSYSNRTIYYIWNGDLLVAEYVPDESTYTYFYDASGSPVGFTYTDETGYYEGGVPSTYFYEKNLQGDIVGIIDSLGNRFVQYNYDAWGNLISYTMHGEGLYSLHYNLAEDNPFRYRGYYYDRETGFYYLQSRYYDPVTGRFINADNNFSNYNLFMYCGNNPVNRIDPNGEHWYYLWIDDLIEAVDELMASVSNIVYGRAAYERSYYDPKGANDLWNSRPFQDTKPSQEMQIFTEFMYDHDFVVDISVSVDTPKNTYVKVGASKVLSPNKNIDASYVHAGIGKSTTSILPINITYSVGIVEGVNVKENYAKSFRDSGAGAIWGFDYCFGPNGSSAYSFTIGTSYGVYAGYDYYWCLD